MSDLDLAPPGDEWWPYIDGSICPPDASPFMHLMGGGVIEVWRAEWGNETQFLTDKSMNPMMNVAGLWWRPA